jgi:hypothetical protein
VAAAAAALYGLPEERFAEHGRLRAEAMSLRDARAASGSMSPADWERIEALLRGSWQSLANAVRGPG